MRKWFVGLGVFIFLIVIIFISYIQLENKEDEKTSNVNNSELFVDSSKANKAFSSTNHGKNQDKGELELGIASSLLQKDDALEFVYEIKNISDQSQTLQFTTSQRYEYEIYDAVGELIQRYSDGKSFLQVLKDIQLAPGETLTFEIQIPDLEKGTYKFVVWPAARGTILLKKTIDFTVN